jgi:hypothetical protein
VGEVKDVIGINAAENGQFCACGHWDSSRKMRHQDGGALPCFSLLIIW